MVTGTLLGTDQPDPLALDADLWANAGGAEGITSFEAKALYATGLVRHLLEAAGKCLESPHSFALPTFVLLSSAAEALGRFLTGDARVDRGVNERVKAGFEDALGTSARVTTPDGVYDVATCKGLRDFTTHGGTTPTPNDVLDPVLTREVLTKLASSLDRFWTHLSEPQHPDRENLDKAKLLPLRTLGRFILIGEMKGLVTAGGSPGAGLLYEGSWRT